MAELTRPLTVLENKALALAQSSNELHQFRQSLPEGIRFDPNKHMVKELDDNSVEVNLFAFGDEAARWVRMLVDVPNKRVVAAYQTELSGNDEDIRVTLSTLDGSRSISETFDKNGRKETQSIRQSDFNVGGFTCSIVWGWSCAYQTAVVVMTVMMWSCGVQDPLNPGTSACVQTAVTVSSFIMTWVCIAVPSIVCSYARKEDDSPSLRGVLISLF